MAHFSLEPWCQTAEGTEGLLGKKGHPENSFSSSGALPRKADDLYQLFAMKIDCQHNVSTLPHCSNHICSK